MALPSLAQILNHASRAVSRLAAQFSESPLLKGMVTAIGNEVQNAENGLWGLLVTRDIDNATDQTLDNIGRLVGAPPKGTKSLSEYRNRIKAQVLANRSDGSAGVIYQIAKMLIAPWNVTGQPKIIDWTIASHTVGPNPAGSIVNSDSDARELARLLDDVSPAGVHAIVLSQTVADTAAFSFENGPGLGFGAGAFVSAYDGRQ